MSTPLRYHTTDEIDQKYALLSKTFKSGTTRPLAYRRRQLLQLARCMQENIKAFEDAVLSDIGKPRLESNQGEIGSSIAGALYAADNLEEWSKPEKPFVKGPVRDKWDASVYKLPKGLVLVIGPWNYPYILTIGPLVGAIAAGCTCVVKASELSPASATVMCELFPKYLDPNAYSFVNGAVSETTHLLDLKWNHILFTGSVKTGQIVAAAAAKHITPVTLELGGKSCALIDPDFDEIEVAARRILYGKQQNTGQLCVSPDYVLVPRAKYDDFVAGLLKAYKEFWPNGPFHEEIGWGKIVNAAHHARLRDLLARTKGEIVIGGEFDGDKRIALTIVKNVQLDDALMEDENFGPILPLVAVDDLNDALRVMNTLYVDSGTHSILTQSGSLVINDTFVQLSVIEIPFGGQGRSGYGGWYGKDSYDTFTHRRSSIHVPVDMEPQLQLRYPPYNEEKYQLASQNSRVKIPDV
ncbi:Aldehyde/histidinol dehydrogenase [Amylocystis lapponica]|nr:Aldehyde/histidinol dehydrogenase [Amylocystis lapponica]